MGKREEFLLCFWKLMNTVKRDKGKVNEFDLKGEVYEEAVLRLGKWVKSLRVLFTFFFSLKRNCID